MKSASSTLVAAAVILGWISVPGCSSSSTSSSTTGAASTSVSTSTGTPGSTGNATSSSSSGTTSGASSGGNLGSTGSSSTSSSSSSSSASSSASSSGASGSSSTGGTGSCEAPTRHEGETCDSSADCPCSLICAQDDLFNPGYVSPTPICVASCTTSSSCPGIGDVCSPDAGYCMLDVCNVPNALCTVITPNDGTCLEAFTNSFGNNAGLCVRGGSLPIGAACTGPSGTDPDLSPGSLCVPGSICDPATSTCAALCTTASDCGGDGGQTCVAIEILEVGGYGFSGGACEPTISGADLCSPCSATEACAAGNDCAIQNGNDWYCGPDCTSGACPTGTTCTDATTIDNSQVSICEPEICP